MRERAASDERETETVDSGIEININQPRGKLMEARFNYAKTAPEAYKAMLGLEQYLRECGLEESLLRLVKARASQINGCAYCLDIHWKDLRAMGRANSGYIRWTLGASVLSTPIVNVLLCGGRRPLL
jgi:AhpD family alkylhydroperoxidase